MKNSLQKGFTLIELLVVIAIIGILSSVVLASLTQARTRGTDAAIQADLSNMRASAELYFSNSNNYGSVANAVPGGSYGNCADVNTVFGSSSAIVIGSLQKMIIAVNTKTGASGAVGQNTARVACASQTNINQTTWAVAASTTSGNWCVDSTGVSKLAPATGAIFAAGRCS